MTHTHHDQTTAPTEGHVIHWARFYDPLLKLVSLGREDRLRSEIVSTAGLHPGQRVLDVGCGTGTLALAAAAMVGAQGRIHGIDPSSEMIARARAKAARAGVTARFEVGVIEALEFPDHSLDVVLSSFMFHHLPETLKRAGLSEIRRVLTPGGRLVIVDFTGFGPLPHRLASLFARHRGADTGNDVDRLVDDAKAAGFAAVETAPMRKRFLFALVLRTARSE